MAASLLTEDEKVRIRHHLGYLNVQQVQTFVLGTPSSVETQFIIEGAFEYVMPSALGLIREKLALCDEIEKKMACALDNLDANAVGNIQLNNQGEDNQQEQLQKAYEWHRSAMANLLGVQANPFDKRLGVYRGRRGINIGVRS
jgi:hypothetical protein